MPATGSSSGHRFAAGLPRSLRLGLSVSQEKVALCSASANSCGPSGLKRQPHLGTFLSHPWSGPAASGDLECPMSLWSLTLVSLLVLAFDTARCPCARSPDVTHCPCSMLPASSSSPCCWATWRDFTCPLQRCTWERRGTTGSPGCSLSVGDVLSGA